MSARIVPFDFQGQAVAFNSDGWINATEAAARFGKEPHEWLRLPDTTAYMEALVKSGIFPELVITKRGRNGGTWLHSKLAVAFARWLSPDFAVWCDQQIDGLLRGVGKGWATARREASIGYRGLCDALSLTCEAQGKTVQRHHFINEARLINEVITGTFAGRNRDQLTANELEIIALVEMRDTVLLGQGMAFSDRKANLLSYVQQLLTKQIGSSAA